MSPPLLTLLDYPRKGQSPGSSTRVDGSKISNFLNFDESSFGKIILIEDIQPQLISYLGETLGIDTLFFSGHSLTEFRNIETGPLPPSLASLPSQIAERGYLHIHYRRVMDLGNEEDFRDCA